MLQRGQALQHEKAISRALDCVGRECGEKGNPCWHGPACWGGRLSACKSLRGLRWIGLTMIYCYTGVVCTPLLKEQRLKPVSSLFHHVTALHSFCATESRSKCRSILSHSSIHSPSVTRTVTWLTSNLFALPTCFNSTRWCLWYVLNTIHIWYRT